MSDDTNVIFPDAFSKPQQVRPGCQHQLGCKCVPPYWLRASTPAEEAREKWLREGLATRSTEFVRR